MVAPSKDSVSNGGRSASTNTQSWAHTLGAGSNLVLFVCVAQADASNLRTVSSVKYGAQNLTQVPSSRKTGTNDSVEWWYLIAPSGNQTITVTLSGSVSDIRCCAYVAKDCDQTTPFGNATTAGPVTTQDASITITSATGELGLAGSLDNKNAIETISVTAGTSQVANDDGSNNIAANVADITGAASVTITFHSSVSNSSERLTSGMSLKPITTATGIPPGLGPVVGMQTPMMAGFYN